MERFLVQFGPILFFLQPRNHLLRFANAPSKLFRTVNLKFLDALDLSLNRDPGGVEHPGGNRVVTQVGAFE